NLALNKAASQSSTYEDSNASWAVDGILDNNLVSGNCSHTDVNQTKAWWKVDLGQVFRIQMINISYRHHGEDILKGYSLYVTNNTSMTRPDGSINEHHGHLCYHANGARSPMLSQTTHSVMLHGQCIVFHNNRSNGEDVFLELCEVQVYGCPVGQFGYNCGGTCHCRTGGCDPDTGQCDVKGCETGWMGLSCSLRCHCDGGMACDIDTGACPGRRCQPGWSGYSCFVGPRDLAHGKTASQSSTNGQFVATMAVDGVITKDVGSDGSCSHTDPEGSHPEAWWEVDLGSVQQIRTINIVYRELYIYRMSGFYLYVSNSSVALNIHQVLRTSHLCYHDRGPGLPSYIQSLSCPVSGQYVIFYNKRPADYEPRNVTYYSETNAVIELCEVQVLGGIYALFPKQWCANHTFGRDCTQTCHCVNSDCNIGSGVCNVLGSTKTIDRTVTCFKIQPVPTRHSDETVIRPVIVLTLTVTGGLGVCKVPGCTEGWKGHTCSQACNYHTFGRDCTQTCHCASSDCDRMTGVCKVPGCTEGWTGDTCSRACINHTFGRDCTHVCQCANSDCDRKTGVCKVPGCTEGWRGQTCSQGKDIPLIRFNFVTFLMKINAIIHESKFSIKRQTLKITYFFRLHLCKCK
ncbi:multiple epidermal growth factor-like domains protein 10, partial [Argopecten irradians]|uniref:multiple epidermal growth factor-like domains protein 10 n=1 Tax=Argopecten irradians TaxID=31199 RepID=UPI0037131936